MRNFSIKPVKKNKQIRNAQKAVLTTALLSTVATTSCPPLGIPIIEMYSKDQALKLIQTQLIDKAGFDLSNDIALNITDGTNDIIFTADLYNADNKVAVEITDDWDYDDQINYEDQTDDLILSQTESDLIKDFRYADHDILQIDYLAEFYVDNRLEEFIKYLNTK